MLAGLAAAAAAVGLAGCGSVNTGQITTFETTVIADAQALCGFKPLFDVVTALVKASPIVQTADQLASAICGAVGPATSNPTFTLNGKTLYGVKLQGDHR